MAVREGKGQMARPTPPFSLLSPTHASRRSSLDIKMDFPSLLSRAILPAFSPPLPLSLLFPSWTSFAPQHALITHLDAAERNSVRHMFQSHCAACRGEDDAVAAPRSIVKRFLTRPVFNVVRLPLEGKRSNSKLGPDIVESLGQSVAMT